MFTQQQHEDEHAVALLILTMAAAVVFSAGAMAREFPVSPYIDTAQLDVPWPKHSHLKQPWRGFLETRSGLDFARGVGINFNVPANEDLAARLLAEACRG